MLFKLKEFFLELNTMKVLSDFYKINSTMVFLFQNMISLVPCRKICAPNHVQVQLSVRVINGWLGSDYIQPVIQNTINSRDYMSLLWNKLLLGCVYVYYVLLTYQGEHIIQSHLILNNVVSCAQKCHWYNKNVILISEYLSHDWQITLPRVNKNTVLFYTAVLFFPTFESIYLKYLKSLQSGKTLILASQTICDHMFSDPKSDHNFFSSFVPGLYISSLVWQFYT